MTTIYQDLQNKKINKLFWQYALPALIGTSVVTLFNIISGVFIGHWIGHDALNAAGLILPIMNMIMGVGLLIGVGSGSRISIYLGQNQHDKAEKVAGTSFLLTLVLSGFTIAMLLLFIDPVLYFVGASPVTHQYAKEFLQIFLPGSIFLTLAFNYNNMMRACGYPLKAMVTMFVSVIANIILSPIFIKILGWGVRGAALATTLSMLLSFIFVMKHFLSKDSQIKLHLKNIRFNFEISKAIISIGLSPFFMQLALSVVIIFINQQLKYYAPLAHISSDYAIGSFANSNRLITLIVMIVIGINQGMQPIIGYNYGANNFSRVKETLNYAIKVATCITSIGFILGMFFPTQLVGIFTPESEIIRLSAMILRFMTLSFIFLGFQMVVTSFFQCIGKAKVSIFLSLLRQVIILFPILDILPRFIGVNGVLLASPISDIISVIITFVIIRWYMKSMSRRYAPHNS